MSAIIKRLLSFCWNWITNNVDATAKVYTSLIPVGKRLGGHDDPNLRDWYIIVDVRAAGKILLLGFFQTT